MVVLAVKCEERRRSVTDRYCAAGSHHGPLGAPRSTYQEHVDDQAVPGLQSLWSCGVSAPGPAGSLTFGRVG